MHPRLLTLIAVCCLFTAGVAARPKAAPGVVELKINGLTDEQVAVVLPALELATYRRRPSIGERRLQRLLGQVEAEVDGALEAFGYYAATTTVEVFPLGQERYRVVLDVDRGEPVRVVAIDVRIDGAANRNERIENVITDFHPAIGEPFDHRVYETSKAAIERALLRRGYLAQKLTTRRVEVSRSDNSARIFLHYDSGTRHFLGPVTFEGAQFDDALLQRFVSWRGGQRFDQRRVEALQQALAASNYFDRIEIMQEAIDPETLRVSLRVLLSPNLRTRYIVGVSFGSDEGAGVRGGIERRWMNSKGHQFLGEAEVAQRRTSLQAEYAVPRFSEKISRYTLALRAQDEQTDSVDARSLLLSANALARGHHWFAQGSLNVLEGSFLVGARVEGEERQDTRVVYPEIRYERVLAEDRVRPPRGASIDTRLLAASDSLLSEVSLVQARTTVKAILPAGSGARLLGQISLGATLTDEFDRLPPELRFFAGGDRSVRGYGYQTLGDRDEGGIAIGGRYLTTLSLEYERALKRPNWSIAGFVDAGDVWSNGKPDLAFGAGIGARWQSPVGPIRIDIARGFNGPERGWQLHLSAGPDL